MINKIICISTLFIFYFLFATHSYAAVFDIVEPSVDVRVGDTVRIPVYIVATDERAIIAQVDMHFSETQLWVKSFDLAPGWLPVFGGEYQFVDNGRGILRKTAGFEGGVVGRTLFGTIEAVMIESGEASFSVDESSSILGDKNYNFFQTSEGAHWDTRALEGVGDLPTSLFDIHMEAAPNVISSSEVLTARVIFQSFGFVPTPVDMFFTITDRNGTVFASSEEHIVVETDAVFTKRFHELALPIGRYELSIVTRYHGGIVDMFDSSFLVTVPSEWRLFIAWVSLFIIIGFTVYYRWLRK